MSVDLEAIRILRQRTSAGLVDCRRALAEAQGDLGAAETLLKDWGLAAVEKRADRETKEGRVFIHCAGGRAAMVELDCETDFVARNGTFRAAGADLAELAWGKELRAPDPELESRLAELAGVFKENLVLRGPAFLGPAEAPILATYLHGEGRIGVILGARAADPRAGEDPEVAALLHDLGLHVAAFGPLFVDGAGLAPAYLEEMRAAYREEVAGDEGLRNKPVAMLEGIVEGKLRKHLREASLLGHGFVRDEKVPVSKILADFEARKGYGLSVSAFARLGVGEGGA